MSKEVAHGFFKSVEDASPKKTVLKWVPFVQYDGTSSYTSHKVTSTGNEYNINRGERLVLNSLADMVHFLKKMRNNQGWKVVFAQKRWKESTYQIMKNNVAEIVDYAKKEGVKRFDDAQMSEKDLNTEPEVIVEEIDEEEIDEEEEPAAPKKRARKKAAATGGA